MLGVATWGLSEEVGGNTSIGIEVAEQPPEQAWGIVAGGTEVE